MLQDSAHNTLPPELQELVEQEINDNEQLLWTGQPVLSTFAKFSLVAVGCSGATATLACIGMVWFFVAMGAPWLFFLLISPIVIFFLWGSLTFLSEPFVERREIRNTVYAITDQRAIILIKKRRTTTRVSYTPDKLDKLRYEESSFGDPGSGSIIFNESKKAARAGIAGFSSIPAARNIERLLSELAAKVPEKTLDSYDDPPILHLIGRTPREIPLSLRLYLRMCAMDAQVGWLTAVFGFAFVIAGLIMLDLFGMIAMLMFGGLGLLFAIVGLCLPYYAWFVHGPKMLHCLQDGIAAKARHLATFPTGKTFAGRKSVHKEMQIDFEYQVDGQQYMASVQGVGHELSRLTDAPCKVVFYDPTEPKQSMLLDKMPLDIYFDELTGRFGVQPVRLVPALLMAAIVCGEIVAIVWLAIWGF